MRILRQLIAGAAVAATAAVLAAGPAMADPKPGVHPRPKDVVGVGSDTIQNVMDQLSVDYNKAHSASSQQHLYSWDATNPKTGAIHDHIVTKTGCPSTFVRPNGSSEGIAALTTQNATTHGHPCLDFARSSRDRAPTDPPFASGGIAFITLAGDAVTYATQATTHAPTNLTTAQLTAIYTCAVTNWNQVGGSNAPIKAFIPQTGSGTRSFFLSAIGVATPGPCVSDGGGKLEENEGVNTVLHSPNAIVPYSVGKFIAQVYHSANCLKASCKPVNGVVCKPKKGQNLFGCDAHGTMKLHKINGTSPTVPFPLPKPPANPVINKNFTPGFSRTLFDVVKFATGTSDHMPSRFHKFFGHNGWVCKSTKAKADLRHYGFLVVSAGTAAGQCGSTH